MNNRKQLQQTITALSTQRILLGDSVVDTTIAVLEEQLSTLETGEAHRALFQERTDQRKQITILFANITGFTTVAQTIPDTNPFDLINILWQRLDKAITNQGGTIDKHIGDAVMGLFGVPLAHEHDPKRAVQAALSMRATLSNIVDELNAQVNHSLSPSQSSSDDQPNANALNLQLRVGINTGPVLLGTVGSGDEYTVIGDAVNVASRLEQVAPSGGILISHETYSRVRGIFNTEPLGPVMIRGKSAPVQMYLVLGAKPYQSFLTNRGVEGIETRMVGRDKELRFLQDAVQTTTTTGSGQIITITGDAGVGKSRLIQEFTDWAIRQPQKLPLFKGQAQQRLNQQPYALIRNILANRFDIQDSDSPRLVKEKLIQGMHQLTELPQEVLHARVQTIGQLIGLDLSSGGHLPIAPTETPQIRDRAYGYLTDFFERTAARSPATLLILEDVHWADKASLDFIDHLLAVCRHTPLLIFGLARPPLFERRTGWGKEDANEEQETAVPQTIFYLDPLTELESVSLVNNILRKLPEIPTNLCDLIVDRAEGNPFYVEELIKVFIDDGLILVHPDKWQLNSTHLDNIRIPSSLTSVLQARLDRLSELERATLQRAAVVGRQFWDTAVIQMNELAAKPMRASETIAALQALEKREMVFKRHTSIFNGTQTLYFKHALLREVTYEGVLLRDRPIFHKQAANWLADQSGERITEYAGVIAEHYEQAGEQTQSAELYEMAAIRAQKMSDPTGAIDYYRQSLYQLSGKIHDAAWQLRLQHQLGKLLKIQSRFVESAQVYMTMRFTAEIDGDLAAQAHAWNGLAAIHREQANFSAMLENATQAEQVAWLVTAEDELTQALLCQSEAHLNLGDLATAASTANRALSISNRQHNRASAAKTISLLSRIYIKSGQHSRAHSYLEELADQLDLQDLAPKSIALNRVEQGRLLRHLERYDEAALEFISALNLYRELDRQPEIAATLNELGKLAHLRGNPVAAIPLFNEGLAIAEVIGDRFRSLLYRTNLGGVLCDNALNDPGQFEMAETELNAVLNLAENESLTVNWYGLSTTYRFLAKVYMGQGKSEEALSAIRQALQLLPQLGEVNATGATWRILGQIAAQLPTSKLPIIIEDQPYNAPSCFAESLRHLGKPSKKKGKTREQALTMWAWAAYSSEHGKTERSETLRSQALALATQLGMELTD